MPAYQPGKGINREALDRLKARKCADAGIADVPAEDSSQQWDRLLGEGAKKKLRCGVCTRPLTEQEQVDKKLVCASCAGEMPPNSFGGLELGTELLYYCVRHTTKQSATSSHNPATRVERGTSSISSVTKVERDSSVTLLTRGGQLRVDTVPRGYTAVSVLSFNVLADCFVRVEGQPWNAFAYCDDAHLTWERRLTGIIRLLQTSAADVICLQEVCLEERAVNGSPVQWTLPAWTDELRGYTGVMQGLKQKEWEKTAERNERVVGRRTATAIATFYKAERFEEVAPSKHGSTSGLAVFLRCRDAGGESPPLELAVGNTHLIGDPSRAGEHVKMLTSLKKNLGKQDHRVICGDFNNECAQDGDVAKWAAEEGFRDAPTGLSWAEPGKAMRLDHILHTPSLRALAVSDPLSPEEVATGLPCETCPSDHSPVAVVFAGATRRRCPW